MLFIKEEQIKSAFVILMNKLYTNRSKILVPLLEDLKKEDSSGEYAKIRELNQEIQQIMEQVHILAGLMAKGYLEPALFNAQNNALQLKLVNLKEDRSVVQGKNESNETVITKSEELVRYFLKEGKILETYEEALFLKLIDKITVLSREEITFQLKNGLCLRERLEV